MRHCLPSLMNCFFVSPLTHSIVPSFALSCHVGDRSGDSQSQRRAHTGGASEDLEDANSNSKKRR
jgi:hypothetical protein